MYQYYCNRCGYERRGLLDQPVGIGGYSWACPECGGSDINSKEVKPNMQEPKTAEQLLALPVRTGVLYVEKLNDDGSKAHIPVISGQKAFFAQGDTVLYTVDEDNVCWFLGKDDEGWFRRRG